ncbi:hypothetical protein [Deinococcus cellulosilyticus]|uniref:Outer membrane protein beta-barrel domain-containing protein n=1 Tax=Deinococcus cellulosilyticus (strain DSM 18568 / NBRC 106333 / KACC 11606 / 5516J-15) TaxID=1223518 RepID=A0A511N830_DEIC1|nr:hypothetical protein [Deinococcus cellulosilyticus]GEM48993.1 hypothetical protein DC3_46280 [Deinococcus cellulosilyticus NBRC 106333 = KACC 11606]
MKKALAVLALGLVLGGAAQAQTFSAGGTFSAPGPSFGANLGVTFKVADLGSNALNARISADVTRVAGVFGFGVNADVLYTIPTDMLNLYVGPSVGFISAGGAGAAKVGAVAGVNYAVSSQMGVFTEGFYNYVINGGSYGGIRAGVTFSL